jgi:hypothetical protein
MTATLVLPPPLLPLLHDAALMSVVLLSVDDGDVDESNSLCDPAPVSERFLTNPQNTRLSPSVTSAQRSFKLAQTQPLHT